MLRRIAGWFLNLIALDGEPWRCARGHHYPGLRRVGPGRYEYASCKHPRCHRYPDG